MTGARFAAWTRLRVQPLKPDGSYDMLALAVPSDSIGPAIGQGLGGRVRNFMSLSLEIGIRFPMSTRVLADRSRQQRLHPRCDRRPPRIRREGGQVREQVRHRSPGTRTATSPPR